MKGKGEVFTYWLVSADENAIQRREGAVPPPFSFFKRREEQLYLKRRSPRLSIDMRSVSVGCRTPSLTR